MSPIKRKMIVLRCDASSEIGWGHVIRCLAVAKELSKENKVIFASAETKDILDVKKSFEVFFKKEKETEEEFLERIGSILAPDIIVLDKKYDWPATILNSLKKAGIKIFIIDNYCSGLKAADGIVFPTAHLDKKFLSRFLDKNSAKKVRSGFDYIILRNEIIDLKKKRKVSFTKNPLIIVTTGGGDPEGVLLKIISWLKEVDLKAEIKILVGQAFKFKEDLERIRKSLPKNFRILPYAEKELLKGDIAICTFGVSVYELIYLGFPILCLSHSKENASGAKILGKRYKVIKDLGYFKKTDPKLLSKSLKRLIIDKDYYFKMAKRCQGLIDGRGAKRVADLIVSTI